MVASTHSSEANVLAAALFKRVSMANHRAFANSGQIAVLNTVAFLQMRNAVAGLDQGGMVDSIRLATSLSKSTVTKHLKFWTDHGVLVREETFSRPSWKVVLPE